MRNSSPLRDLAEHLRKQAQEEDRSSPAETLTGPTAIVVEAFDNALLMIGRQGTDVFHDAMKRLYGFDRTDIAAKPGAYMSALKAMLDSCSDVIEHYILKEIQRTKNIQARSVEEAVAKLKLAEETFSPERY